MFGVGDILFAAAQRVSGELNEPDVLVQWPAFGIGLIVLGLAADIFLIMRWVRRRGVATKPWGLSMVFAVLGISAAVFLSVSVVGVLLKLSMTALLALLGATELSLLGVMLICLRVEKVDWRELFGVSTCTASQAILVGVLFFLAVQPPLVAFGAIRDAVYHAFGWKIDVQDIVSLFLRPHSGWLTLVLIVFAIVVAPLCEETFFRGLIYPAIKQRWGAPAALAIVSGLFALIHFHVPSLPLLFTLAVGLALAYEFTGSLVTPITVHALFNLMNVIAILLYRQKP
jgi:membrane protease YdiL (CAAX protease family)